MAVAVRGLRELNRTFKYAPKDTRRELKDEYRTVADPVHSDAETLAASTIRRIGPNWSKMRVGITTTLVYVAPKKRGVKVRGADPRKRPNLSTLLAEQALEPALERNRWRIQGDFDRMLDRLVNKWDHDGP